MDYDATRELHRELVYRLSRELTFYRSLFLLIDRQREAAERGDETELALRYGELRTLLKGLAESQFAIKALREKEPKLFGKAVQLQPIPEIVQQASEILAASLAAVKESKRSARQHYRKLHAELAKLGTEHKAIQSYTGKAPAGRITDGSR